MINLRKMSDLPKQKNSPFGAIFVLGVLVDSNFFGSFSFLFFK